jgi:hypothetical protein
MRLRETAAETTAAERSSEVLGGRLAGSGEEP